MTSNLTLRQLADEYDEYDDRADKLLDRVRELSSQPDGPDTARIKRLQEMADECRLSAHQIRALIK